MSSPGTVAQLTTRQPRRFQHLALSHSLLHVSRADFNSWHCPTAYYTSAAEISTPGTVPQLTTRQPPRCRHLALSHSSLLANRRD
eukprot:1072387-Pyramimonas_sp.AAC.1